MELRPYQSEAMAHTLHALQGGQHPVIAMPTGSGKSAVIATLCQTLPGRILVVTHSRELVDQNAVELHGIDTTQDIGIYSAGLRRRETGHRIVFAGVQSIYRKMPTLTQAGPFAYVIIDEAHTIAPQDSAAKMYAAVFAGCETAQRIGLSATPFRLDDGRIYGPAPCWFDTLAYSVGIKDLTPDYLVPLRGIHTAHDVDVSHVAVRQGEFVTAALSKEVCNADLIDAALSEALRIAYKRSKLLVFCVDVPHVQMVAAWLTDRQMSTAAITGHTPSQERAAMIEGYRNGVYRFMVNCETLTTGFNVKDVDAIILLRPTQSKGLLVQMLGRGTRQYAGKRDCLVLDMAGNLARHAPLDEIYDDFRSPDRVKKDTEQREREERERLERQLPHDTLASEIDPMEGTSPPVRAPVDAWYYKVEESKNPRYAGTMLLKVMYRVKHQSTRWLNLFVCPEYQNTYVQRQAVQWFQQHRGPVARTAREAYRYATEQRYAMPKAVTFRKEGKYYRILEEHF